MINLAQSNRIIESIFARGRELGCRPLSVIVVEPGAKVKAFQKEDDSSMMRFEMAFGKAYAALALGRSSSLVRMRTEERPLFMQYLIRASDDQIFPEGGGMLIRDKTASFLALSASPAIPRNATKSSPLTASVRRASRLTTTAQILERKCGCRIEIGAKRNQEILPQRTQRAHSN